MRREASVFDVARGVVETIGCNHGPLELVDVLVDCLGVLGRLFGLDQEVVEAYVEECERLVDQEDLLEELLVLRAEAGKRGAELVALAKVGQAPLEVGDDFILRIMSVNSVTYILRVVCLETFDEARRQRNKCQAVVQRLSAGRLKVLWR